MSFRPFPTHPAGELIVRPVLSVGDFLPGLVLALAIGLLIGIERGWKMRGEDEGERVAGLRTFAILGLFGGILGFALRGEMQELALVLAGAALGAILLGYLVDMRHDRNVSATSAVAAVVTIGLGATATALSMAMASIGAGAVLLLLASRKALHQALAYTSEEDLRALVRLALIALVILPVLPDAGMGPYGLNPRRLWLVVVTIGAISFSGHTLARWLGPRRGVLITAVLGSLVSSTAVTVESARRIREGSAVSAGEAAIALATLVMLLRSLLLVAVLAPPVLPRLALLIGPASGLAAALFALTLHRSRQVDVAPVEVRPPGLGLAFLFALLVAVLTTAAGWAEDRFGGRAAALAIAFGGMADVDSAVAAVATLPATTLSARMAAYAIAGPILFNTLLKLGLVLGIAGWRRSAVAAGILASVAIFLAVAGMLLLF